MLYRIDLENYLLDLIDFFTRDEILSFHNIIISTRIAWSAGATGPTHRLNSLYPNVETQTYYLETKNFDTAEEMYFDMLESKDGKSDIRHIPEYAFSMEPILQYLVRPILNNAPVLMLCMRDENWIVDMLSHYMKKKYNIDTIDLNQLFSKGSIGPISIDMDELRKMDRKNTGIVAKDTIYLKSLTEDGRREILHAMTEKDKIRKCKELGIKLKHDDLKKLDKILLEGWVADD